MPLFSYKHENILFYFFTKWLVPEGHESKLKPVGEVQHCSELSMNSAVMHRVLPASPALTMQHTCRYIMGLVGRYEHQRAAAFPANQYIFSGSGQG